MYEEDKILIGVMVVVVIIFIIVIIVEGNKEDEFNKFIKDHHCEIIGYSQGKLHTSTGIASNGYPAVVLNKEPDKTGYKCDDGMEHWR